MLGIKSMFRSMLHSSSSGVDSTRASSTKQPRNADQPTDSMATRTAPSAADKEVLVKQSKRERALALLHIGKSNHAKQQDAAIQDSDHVKYPLVGLNAMLFEESVLDSIQMDASDKKSWSTRAKDMDYTLAKLKFLGPDQIHNLSAQDRAALAKIFQRISTGVQDQQAQIDTIVSNRVQELQSKIDEIHKGKKSASPNLEVRKILNTYNKGFKELERAKQTLNEIENQADRLFRMTPVHEVLRGKARHMRELDSISEGYNKSNEKERFARLKDKENNKAQSISEIMRNPDLEAHEQLDELNALTERHKNASAMEGQFWEVKLANQREDKTEVANQIVDLFAEAADTGVDLSKELSADEIIYLTKAMGRAEKFSANPSLTEEEKLNTLGLQRKLARQNEDLLHGPQLKKMLTRLSSQETRLNEAIKHLSPIQPNSAALVLEKTEEVLNSLRHIDRHEVSRLINHNEEKKEMAESHIAENLNQIWTRAETLRGVILNALESPEGRGFTNADRRQLAQAEKLLEQVTSNVNALY